MVKNTTGGKKHKKAKNVVKVEKIVESDNEFQFYAKVNKKLGGGNFNVDVFIPQKRKIIKNEDGSVVDKIVREEQLKKNQMALIRGSIRKRCRIDVGNIVLVSLREFEERKVDIIHSYRNDDVNYLRRSNKLPKTSIFDNDDANDINFELSDDDSNDNNTYVSVLSSKKKTDYTSNYDLIPDLSEDEIENM